MFAFLLSNRFVTLAGPLVVVTLDTITNQRRDLSCGRLFTLAVTVQKKRGRENSKARDLLQARHCQRKIEITSEYDVSRVVES